MHMSSIPQRSSVPDTLPINEQHIGNFSMVTPNDLDSFSLSTPDLINVLSTQANNDELPSSGLFGQIEIQKDNELFFRVFRC